MAIICKECGCENRRQDNIMGSYCNNCGSKDFLGYDKNEIGVSVQSLKNKYKEEFRS